MKISHLGLRSDDAALSARGDRQNKREGGMVAAAGRLTPVIVVRRRRPSRNPRAPRTGPRAPRRAATPRRSGRFWKRDEIQIGDRESAALAQGTAR